MSINRDLADWGHQQPYRKNLIINGGMNIWQRGTSFAAHPDSTYAADRWKYGHSTTSVTTHQQISNNGLPAGQTIAYEMSVTTADTSIATSDFGILFQPIEGYNILPLSWHLADQTKKKDITLSFYSAHVLTGTHCVSIRNKANNRSYVAEYTQAVTGAWEKHTITIPAPTDGTWDVDNTTGLQLAFCVTTGATYQTTADAWQTGNYLGTSNQVNNYSSVSNFFRISGVQLEVGTEATDFEYRTFQEELQACQRYYQKSFPYATAPAENALVNQIPAIGVGLSTTLVYTSKIRYSVTMAKNVPTVTLYRDQNSTTDGRWAYYSSGWQTPTAAPSLFDQEAEGFTVKLNGCTAGLDNAYLVAGEWTADAEL